MLERERSLRADVKSLKAAMRGLLKSMTHGRPARPEDGSAWDRRMTRAENLLRRLDRDG